MKKLQEGVFEKGDKIYTIAASSSRVYGEKFIEIDGETYREWNPNRSKAAAAIKNGINIELNSNNHLLYLGAASGTTVSHFSDILEEGFIYGVEYSDTVFRDLLELAEDRENIAPFLDNARKPENYGNLVSEVDIVFQDISQRDQPEIFIRNCKRFLKKGGIGLLAVKARSISSSEDKKVIYNEVKDKLSEEFRIIDETELEPYEKDHLFLKLEKKN